MSNNDLGSLIEPPAIKPHEGWVPWGVAVIASPRYVSLLDKTIESLWKAGFTAITIFAEQGTERECVNRMVADYACRDGWHGHPPVWVTWKGEGRRAGPFNATMMAVRQLVKIGWMDPLLVVQDDVVVCRDLRARLEAAYGSIGPKHNSNFGVMQLYQSMANDQGGTGWTAIRPEDMRRRTYGAQGYVFSRESAADFVEHYWDRRKEIWSGVDPKIAEWCLERRRLFWQHSPSLVLHMGAVVGTLGNEHWQARIAGRFVDELNPKEVAAASE